MALRRLAALVLLLASACVSPHRAFPQFSAQYHTPAPQMLYLETEIDEMSVLPLILDFQNARGNVVLTINSPGGGVWAGLELIESMREAQSRGVSITCLVPKNGMAASMAAAVLQSCDTRLMARRGASLLFHTVSVGEVSGNQFDFERLTRMMRSLNKRLAILCSARLKISLADYEANVADFDWWLGADESLAVGAVDGLL